MSESSASGTVEKCEEDEELERQYAAFDSREKVLVVVHYDGYIQVYAKKWVDVRCVELRAWDDEEGKMSRLPLYYRDVYWPVNLRETAQVQWIEKPVYDQEAIDCALLGADWELSIIELCEAFGVIQTIV